MALPRQGPGGGAGPGAGPRGGSNPAVVSRLTYLYDLTSVHSVLPFGLCSPRD